MELSLLENINKVFPSLKNGLKRLYKIPVIRYDCKCGPKEIIKKGLNGNLLFFNVAKLAYKTLKLISDSELLQSYQTITGMNFRNSVLRTT